MKIAIVCPNWVGDAVMATPTLRALRRRFAEAEIVGLVRSPIQQVLAGTPLLDRLLVHNHRRSGRKVGAKPFLETVRAERFDLAVLLTNSFRTAMLTWRAEPVQSHGDE